MPNIAGGFSLAYGGLDSQVIGYCSGSGAFSKIESTESNLIVGLKGGSEKTKNRGWAFNASNYSNIYKNNALPESKSLSLKYWLRNA